MKLSSTAWPALILAAGVAGAAPAFQETAPLTDATADERGAALEDDSPIPIEIEPEVREEIDTYFAKCDHDENGWIAYREARESLELDRPSYASYDSDRDGRIDLAEFERRYFEIVDVAGGFAEPLDYEGPRLLPTRNPEQLRAAFDTTGDGALELFEVEKLLEIYDRQDIPALIVLSKLDTDGTRRLEVEELKRLSQLLSATYVESSADLPADLAGSIEELFGGLVARPQSEFGQTLHPPQIVGPVSPFRRLDLDYDGAIEIADLTDLQRPQTLSVRVEAIIAALDQNEDGQVDRSEFLAGIDD